MTTTTASRLPNGKLATYPANRTNSAGEVDAEAVTFEKALVTAVLYDFTNFRAAPNLAGSEFVDKDLGRLWDTMREMNQDGKVADIKLILSECKRRGLPFGGDELGAMFGDAQVRANHAGYYATEVDSAVKRRRLVAIADEILSGAQDVSQSPDELLQFAREGLAAVSTSAARSFAGKDVTELEGEGTEVDWLVEDVFAADQPTVFGAGSKCLKTTTLVDLSVALATGGIWLGHFNIPRQRRVLFITGESTERAIRRRVKKALDNRFLEWDAVKGWLSVEAASFPQLPSIADQQAIADDVQRGGFEVVIVDPLYRGLSGIDTYRMAEVGPAIVSFTKACRPAAVIISHHVTKTAVRAMEPPSLEDLSGAGLAESCGNWWLVGRNKKYEYDRQHDLMVCYGGRDEQAGLKRIEVDESTWTFTVSSGADIIEQKAREQQEQRAKQREDKLREARAKIESVMRNQKIAKPKKWIEDRAASAGTQTTIRAAVGDMMADGTLVEQEYKDTLNRTQKGLILGTVGGAR